ncbi:acyl-CoA synthetase [Microbacterium sp. NPDC058342]|uniref:acyl-CoA synthetase n=1 Tax=Microbacterium sp. NPDC058342 TaxID=3346454 RepID=UPI0036604A88
MPPTPRPFTARHVHLSRAVLAAVAAVMITFTPDHSAAVGMAVFGGFGIATGLVLILSAVIVFDEGRRWPMVVMGALSTVLGMAASVPSFRTDTVFFVLVIVWAATTGLVELLAGIRFRGQVGARDAIVTGSLGLLLALVLLLIPAGFVQEYTTPQGEAALTGIIIGVGLFGGYAAIVAVFQAIAGLTPDATKKVEADASADHLADHGGHA